MRRVALASLLSSLLMSFLSSCAGNGGEPIDPGAAPAVTTLTTTGVGTTGATLNGSVNPNGLATDAWFEWGTSSSLATFDTTSIQALGAGTSSQPVMATLSGLSSATTYYYRVAASNSTGPAKGSIESFTTTSPDSFGVVSTTPANNATDVPLGDPITVTFNQDVEPATLVDAIAVSSVTGNLPGVISYNSTTKTAIFTPTTPFAPLTDYTVTVDAKVKSVTTAETARTVRIRLQERDRHEPRLDAHHHIRRGHVHRRDQRHPEWHGESQRPCHPGLVRIRHGSRSSGICELSASGCREWIDCPTGEHELERPGAGNDLLLPGLCREQCGVLRPARS